MSRHHGFTLIEILVAVGIIAILVAILFPVLGAALRKGKEATCMTNMREIHQAITQYWQDHNHSYPTFDNPMGALVNDGKLPAKRVCPMEADRADDTYAALYNYWGYAVEKTPIPMKALPLSGTWTLGNNYDPTGAPLQTPARPNLVVLNGDPKQVYACIRAHTAAAVNQPESGADWQVYWAKLPEYWWNGNNTPDTNFTGLVNPNAPGNTIVTICPNHVGNAGRYIVLRVSGDIDFGAPSGAYDPLFWSLSKPIK